MNRKLIAVLLLFIFLLGGCSVQRKDITREEIVAAYQDAGYSVCTRDYDVPLEYGQIGYIRADHPGGDYIYFSIFQTQEQAKAYKQEYYHPWAMGLFSSIFAGELYFPKWDVYGCFVIQYENTAFYEVFRNLQTN